MRNEESNEILNSYLCQENNKDSLIKIFGDISSISEKEKFKNFHYMCKICLKFPIIKIIDNDNIQLICDNKSSKSFNQTTSIKDAYKRIIELKDNKYDIFVMIVKTINVASAVKFVKKKTFIRRS